jgi:hypothetical protein
MTEKTYDVMTAECPRCKIQQNVHIAGRLEVGQAVNEIIACFELQQSL